MDSPVQTHFQRFSNTESSPGIARVFEARQISIGYKGKVILENVNFKIDAGDFIFITGKTGSGKTTFLNFIDSDKTVKLFNGQANRFHKDSKTLFKSYIYQDLKTFGDMTVLQNLQLVYDPEIYRGIGEFIESVENYCKVLDIYDQLNKKLNVCNGATAQKVAIIRSILTKPRLILADEPTSSLDSVSTHKIYDLLSLLNYKTKMSIVWVTHDRELVKKFNGKIYNIEGRKIIDVRRYCFT